MVSIGTNTSITFILQSTIWLIFLSLIPKVDPDNKLTSKFLFCLPLLLIFQFLVKIDFIPNQILCTILKSLLITII